MNSRFFAPLVLSTFLMSGPAAAIAQNASQAQSDASPSQRIEIVRSRLESMRRSLNSAAASIIAKDDGDAKNKDADDPRTRLTGLEREASTVLSEANDLKAKLDRAERVESEQISGLETATTDLQSRVESAMQATASVRNAGAGAEAATRSRTTTKKKKGRLFGLLGGGGGDEEKYADLTGSIAPGRDRALFEEATKEVRKSSHETGRLLFNTIITTYPDSAFLPLAKLAIADSFYLEGTTSALIQAAAGYQDWLTFFPTDPLADRVMLKMAECEMRQMGLPDRENTKAKKAEQRLKVLLQQFPDTALKDDVAQRLNEVQENLGMHDLSVARFYYERQIHHKGGLKGAQSRLQEIAQKYQSFSYLDEVYFRLGTTYVLEEEPDEAAKYFQRVARDYPNSQYAEKAVDQLKLIGAPVPDPDPIKKNMPEPERPSFTQKLITEVSGTADITVDKNGVLISKDSDKAGHDLIDQAIANQGQVAPMTTPIAPVNRRAPAKTFAPAPAPTKAATGTGGAQVQQGTNGTPDKP
jgi:outer membrane protein assembly factor BamD